MFNIVKSAEGGRKILIGLIILVVSLFFSGVVQSKDKEADSANLKQKVFVHYPKPHKDGRMVVDSCSPTSNDQVNDFLLAGWQIPSGGIAYQVNAVSFPKSVKSTALGAIQNAFSTWTAADSDKIFNYAGNTKKQAGKLDFQNVVSFKGVSPSYAIAVTYIWYYPSTGTVADVDTVFNKSYSWSVSAYTGDCNGIPGTYDLQNIGTHEFGHWVGLDDLYSGVDKDLTMYGYGDTKELKKDTLGLGDITGVGTVAP